MISLLLACALAADPPAFRIRLATGETVALPLERYVAAVLAGEASVFRSGEALKSMAIAARTYAVRLRGRHAVDGYDFCTTTHCQRAEPRGIAPRLESAIAETTGELLWFEGKLAFACYSRDCGGRTEDAGAAWPDLAASYLVSHADPYCVREPGSGWESSAAVHDVEAAMQRAGLRVPREIERIAVTERTRSGRARVLSLSGVGETVPVSASSFRFALGRSLGWNTLAGDSYDARVAGDRVLFRGKGGGHGVGLCQRGADRMGLEGRTWLEILAFYYPGTAVGLTARGVSWQRLRGESIVVLATQLDWGRTVLMEAESTGRALAQRLKLPLPASTEIRVYPDMDTFRNATGEPGWVAAYTAGSRVHLQPALLLRRRGALRRTLQHELLHVIVEQQAAPGLPVWFREGVVGFFESPQGRGGLPDEAGLRQRQDAGRARQAYRGASGQVALLVERYGEETVLGWLRRGLPPEVRNSSAGR